MTIAIKDSPGTNSSGKQGFASQNSESKPGESTRTNPVCLDVAVTIRSLPNEASALSKPIREEVRTVIIFDNGAVLRCAENLPIGYTVILSNSNGRDVVCRVVGGRNLPSIKGYVEVQFIESVSDFWSTYQDAGPGVPAASQAAPLALRETPSPALTAAPSRPAAPSQATSNPVPIALGSAPRLDEIGGRSNVSVSAAPRESKSKQQQRPGPELAGLDASSYSHSENAKPSTIGGWNSSGSDSATEKQANPALRESSANDSSASSSGPSRDFMSKGLMAYDKPQSSATALKGRLPQVVGIAVLALGGISAVVFFTHRNATPAPVTTSAIISKPTASQIPAAANAPEPFSAPLEAVSPAATKAQPAAQPVAVELTQSAVAPIPVPAVVTSPVTADARSEARNVRRPEKNAIADKQPVPLASPRPAMTNLKMSSPSAPTQKLADLGGGAAPSTEIAASEAVGGSPSTGMLTSSGRISNPPTPPPSSPTPIAATKTVSVPKLISSTRLAYPQAARQAKIQGTVSVSASIDETGRVVSATALSGPLLLREAALNSVKQWKYSPGLLDGKPTPSEVTVGLEFKLN